MNIQPGVSMDKYVHIYVHFTHILKWTEKKRYFDAMYSSFIYFNELPYHSKSALCAVKD